MNVIIAVVCWLCAILYAGFDIPIHPAINGIVITVLVVSGMFCYSIETQEKTT